MADRYEHDFTKGFYCVCGVDPENTETDECPVAMRRELEAARLATMGEHEIAVGYMRDLEAERALCERFRLAIIEAEWAKTEGPHAGDLWDACPWCGADQGNPHAADCVVAQARDASARGEKP